MHEYEGYPLFKDVEDRELRVRNMATTMANIYEDSAVKGRINAKAMSLLAGYLKNVSKEDRRETYSLFSQLLKTRGLVK